MLRSALRLGLLTLSLIAIAPNAHAEGVGVASATRAQLKAATKEFNAANKAFDKGRYDQALTRFHASYEIVRSPSSILMIARCERELGRVREAYASYAQALQIAEAAAKTDPTYQQAITDATDDLTSFKKEIALVTVGVMPEGTQAEVRIGDTPVGNREKGVPLPLAPGQYKVTAHAPSGANAEQQLSVVAGEERSITLELSPPAAKASTAPTIVAAPPPAPSGSPLRTAAYVSGGVGVAGAVVFGVFGVMSKSKYNELKDTCPAGACPASRQGDIDAGRRDQTIANVGLVVGVLGIGAGVTLFALSGRREQSVSSRLGAATAHESAALVVGPNGVVVRGRF